MLKKSIVERYIWRIICILCIEMVGVFPSPGAIMYSIIQMYRGRWRGVYMAKDVGNLPKYDVIVPEGKGGTSLKSFHRNFQEISFGNP